MSSTFDVSELLDAIRAVAIIAGDEGMTTREFANRKGVTVPVAGRLLHELWANGELELAGKKMVPTMGGYAKGQPAYRYKRK